MTTTLFLIRHGATESNLAQPPRLQGRGHNPPLAAVGIRQAELTRDLLAVQHIDACYCSPLERAVQTADIIVEPHGLAPAHQDDLTECHVGDWEGLSWEEIEQRFPTNYRDYMTNPALHGYPAGETFADVHRRATGALDEIFACHRGEIIVVVAHHVVNRVYLAGLLGLPPEKGRQVSLGNCSISIVTQTEHKTEVKTLNSTFHLKGAA